MFITLIEFTAIIEIIISLGLLAYGVSNENADYFMMGWYILGLGALTMFFGADSFLIRLICIPGVARGAYEAAFRIEERREWKEKAKKDE